MRKFLTLFILSMVSTFALAQGTYTNYKAVIKNASGNLMTNQSVQVRFTIFEGTTTQVFTETHATTTDAHGIVVLNMGSVGTGWANINWGDDLHYLKVEYNTGSGFVDLGTQSFRYVPYAQFAIRAESADNAASAESINFSDVDNKPTTLAGYGITDAFSGSFTNLTNVPAGLSDGDNVLTEAQVDAYADNNGYLELDPTDAITLPLVNNNSTGESKGIDITMNSDNNTKNGISITMQGTTPSTGVSAGIIFNDQMNGTQNKYGIYQQFEGTGNSIYGVRNMFSSTSNYASSILGVSNYIESNQDGTHYGTHNYLSGSGSGTHHGIYNNLTGSGTGTQKAIYNAVSNTGNGEHYGTQNYLNGSGSGGHYGIYNELSGAGTGTQRAIYNRVTNTGNDTHYGNYNYLSGSGSGYHYGIYNDLAGAGTGVQYATYNSLTNTGNGNHFGTLNYLSGSGSGGHYGIYNELSGAGTGTQRAIYNAVSNTGNGFHYGNYNYLNGTGSGLHLGIYNDLAGAGIGTQYAIYNTVTNTGNGTHFGTFNYLNGSGSGVHYGIYNELTGAGTGTQRAIYNAVANTGDGTHYGTHNYLSGSGSGIKYGIYSKVDAAAGGTHYAVWGEAEKAGSYAGYFKGDVYNSQNVKVVGELQGSVSGDADMKAYVYGYVTASGTITVSASSDGYTVARTSTGTYKITFSDTSLTSTQYMATVVVVDAVLPQIATIYQNSGNFDIHIWDISGAHVDSYFTFVVYKK